MAEVQRSAKDTLTMGAPRSAEDDVCAAGIFITADVAAWARIFTAASDAVFADGILVTEDVVSTGAADDGSTGKDVLMGEARSVPSGATIRVGPNDATSYVAGVEALPEAGSITQSLSLGVGKGFDSASGNATQMMRSPPDIPPIRTAESDARPAAVAA
jgi:hypothetical protein